MRARMVLLCSIATLAPTATRPHSTQPPILECKLNEIETVAPNLKRTRDLIRAGDGAPVPQTLIIAGIGTPTVIAKANTVTLVLGTRVLPMPGADGQAEDSNDWFYARSELGITVLEVPKADRPNVEVRLHSLGKVPYTFVGRCR